MPEQQVGDLNKWYIGQVGDLPYMLQ